AFTFPAEALQAHDLDHQLGALLPQLGAELLEHRADLRDAALRLAFLGRAARGEEEGVPADLEIGDPVAQDLVGDRAALVGFDVLLRDVGQAGAHHAGQTAAAREVGALVLEQALADRPALAFLADEVL